MATTTTSTSDMTSVAMAMAAPRRPRANTIGDTHPSRVLDKTVVPRDCCSSGSFVTKLYKMVDTEPTTIVTWIRGGSAFCIVDPKMMAEHCLPKYFRHRRFSSLIRQLNFYSFYRVQEGQLTIYQHSFFRKGRPDLLVHIKRRGAGKAKDPWFDPLAPPTKPPVAMTISPGVPNIPLPGHCQSFSDISGVGPANGMCYSPMAKPLPVSIDNMSPALKPGVAQLAPPMVELGGSSYGESEKYVESQRWENQLLSFHDHRHDFGGTIVKAEVAFADMNGLSTTPAIMKSVHNGGGLNGMDIDIQDFLTDDCTINACLVEKQGLEDRSYQFMNAVPMASKFALVARDCLKLDSKDEAEARSSCETVPPEDDSAFEEELLSDLATVEAEAWEVPLSPLNDAEDVMPWLDLCF